MNMPAVKASGYQTQYPCIENVCDQGFRQSGSMGNFSEKMKELGAVC